MKKLLFLFAVPFLFLGCSDTSITKEDCLKEGLVFKSSKALNYRTGEYEDKQMCVKKG